VGKTSSWRRIDRIKGKDGGGSKVDEGKGNLRLSKLVEERVPLKAESDLQLQ